MEAINPTTGERIHHYDEHDPSAVDRALTAARQAFERWRDAPWGERAAALRAAAAELRDNAAEHARTMTLEMGKPIAAAEAEVEKCAWACEHFAEFGERYLAPET